MAKSPGRLSKSAHQRIKIEMFGHFYVIIYIFSSDNLSQNLLAHSILKFVANKKLNKIQRPYPNSSWSFRKYYPLTLTFLGSRTKFYGME